MNGSSVSRNARIQRGASLIFSGSWSVLKSPAVAAAFGSCIGFVATQAAQIWHESRTENTGLMLDELRDGRELTGKLKAPETSAEAQTVITQLRLQSSSFETPQARFIMQNTIAVLDSLRANLAVSEKEAADTKQAAADAAAQAAIHSLGAAAAQKAQQDAQAAAAAAAAAEQKRQAEIKIIQGAVTPGLGVNIGRLRF